MQSTTVQTASTVMLLQETLLALEVTLVSSVAFQSIPPTMATVAGEIGEIGEIGSGGVCRVVEFVTVRTSAESEMTEAEFGDAELLLDRQVLDALEKKAMSATQSMKEVTMVMVLVNAWQS
jgi:hypothetical protein